MLKKLFVFFLWGCTCLGITGCGEEPLKPKPDERGLYLIHDTFSVYSDEEDPKFVGDHGVTSIKEFLPQSNCLPSCIHDKDTPSETLEDGTTIYDYVVEGETYYYIQCNKSSSKYHNGRDILIGKNKNKLISLC